MKGKIVNNIRGEKNWRYAVKSEKQWGIETFYDEICITNE